MNFRERIALRILGLSPKDLEVPEEKQYPTAATLPRWQDGRPHFTDWNTGTAVEIGYKLSSTLYACIEVISDAAASVPLVVYRRNDPQDEWEPSTQDEPIMRLLEKPNPFMDRQIMVKRLAQQLLLGGNGFWTKLRLKTGENKGLVVEMWPIGPDGIQVVKSRTKFISHYEFRRDREILEIKPENIIHFMQVNPNDVYWGMGAVQALNRVIQTDNEAVNFQKISFQNRGSVSAVLSFKQPLSGSQYDQARKEVDEGISGVANARRILVLGSEANYQTMNQTMEELDFTNSRVRTREEIAQGMRVPPPMVGIYEKATLANIETSRKIFWLDRMQPFLQGLEGAINGHLVPDFGDPDTMYVGFDMGQVDALQDGLQMKVEAFSRLVESRVQPMAAARITGLDLTDDDVMEVVDSVTTPFGDEDEQERAPSSLNANRFNGLTKN